MRRALALAVLLALVAGGREAVADSGPPLALAPAEKTAQKPAHTDSKASDRDSRLARAEAFLAEGRPGQALMAFEQAAQQEHAVDIELGILRSEMQAGQYQQALAFAAHTAGAHPEQAAGAAFYAWLLHLGGQQAFAVKTLRRAELRLPGDPALARVRARMENAGDDTSAPVPPHERLAPYSVGEPVPPDARVIGAAVLLAGGQLAVAPAAGIAPGAKLLLRDGLGRAVRASVRQRDADSGLALLALDEALPDPGTVLAPDEAFAGSPAIAFAYVPGSARDGAWPHASIGFLGRPAAMGARPLGIALSPGMQGAPVVDRRGRLVGLSLSGRDGQPLLAGIAAVRGLAGEEKPKETEASASGNLPLAQLYEGSLRMALQVIVAP